MPDVIAALRSALPGRQGAARQTLTIGRPAAEVLAAWRDPDVLSRLLGDLGRVDLDEGGYVWALAAPEGGGDAPQPWRSTLSEDADGLHFTGEGPSRIDLLVAQAPHGLGSEAMLELHLPVPGLLAGATAFTLLYRTRALLQTGEIPSLGPQPSARPSPR